jgi:hypothetical protein
MDTPEQESFLWFIEEKSHHMLKLDVKDIELKIKELRQQYDQLMAMNDSLVSAAKALEDAGKEISDEQEEVNKQFADDAVTSREQQSALQRDAIFLKVAMEDVRSNQRKCLSGANSLVVEHNQLVLNLNLCIREIDLKASKRDKARLNAAVRFYDFARDKNEVLPTLSGVWMIITLVSAEIAMFVSMLAQSSGNILEAFGFSLLALILCCVLGIVTVLPGCLFALWLMVMAEVTQPLLLGLSAVAVPLMHRIVYNTTELEVDELKQLAESPAIEDKEAPGVVDVEVIDVSVEQAAEANKDQRD